MHPVLFNIFGREIRFYGVMIAIGFFVALKFGKKHAKEENVDQSIIENFAFIGLISGIIGARIYYVIFNWKYYSANPLDIPAIWHGGLAIHGGIIGGIIAVCILSKIHKINPFIIGDIFAGPFLLGQAFGRIGNFMNGEIHGVPTFTPWKIIFHLKPIFFDWYQTYIAMPMSEKMKFKELVPWGIVFPDASPAGMEFPNLPLHPAMLYEMILNFIGFILIYYVFRKSKKRFLSSLWWSYLIIYSLNRIFVSFFRAEDLMFFSLRAPHVISFICIIVAIIGAFICYKKYGTK